MWRSITISEGCIATITVQKIMISLSHDISMALKWSQYHWLMVYLPLWKTWKSVGLMNSQYMESHKIHVPNHQPDYKPRLLPQLNHHEPSFTLGHHHQSVTISDESIVWLFNIAMENVPFIDDFPSCKPPFIFGIFHAMLVITRW